MKIACLKVFYRVTSVFQHSVVIRHLVITMTEKLLCSEYVINMIVTSYEKEDFCVILIYH